MAKAKNTYGPVQLTPANKLYLYQLLGESIGIGKQTFSTRALEALAEQEITPESLGHESAQSLFEALSDFVQLTPFKGGRLYVTVLRQEEWDDALEAIGSAKPEGGKQAGGKGGKGKPWKRRKGGLKPVRPKLIEPVTEEPAEEEPPAAETAAGEAAVETAADVAVEKGDEAEASVVAGAGDTTDNANKTDEQAPAAAEMNESATGSGVPSILEQIEAQVGVVEATTSTAGLTAEAQPAAKATPGAAADEQQAAMDAQANKLNGQQSAAPQAADTTAGNNAAEQPVPEAPKQASPLASLLEQIEAQTVPFEPAPAEPAANNQVGQSDLSSHATSQGDAATSPASTASVAAGQPTRNAELPKSFIDEVSPKAALMGLLTRMLPIDADVLTILDEDWRVARATGTATGTRNLVTFPLRYLQEDGSAPVSVTIKRSSKATGARRWQLALVDGDDGTGRAHEAVGLEGLPQEQGGCWAQLSPRSHAASMADPARDLAQFMEIGTWEQALGTLARTAAPERWNYPGEGVGAKSRYGVLRDYLASTLARVRATDALATAADGSLAAFDTGLLSPLDEKLYAVLSPTGIDIPWHLEGFAEAGSGELGSRLVATIGELPAQASYLRSIDDVAPRVGAMVIPDYRALLSECLDRLPQGWLREQLDGTGAAPAFEAFCAAAAPAEQTSAKRTLAHAIEGEPALFRRLCRALDDAIGLSMRRAQASYRHVAPAYDAARDRMLLLLPLALVDETNVDCALALELMPSGAYQAASIVTLPAAYAAARTVSSQMPTWLTAERALG